MMELEDYKPIIKEMYVGIISKMDEEGITQYYNEKIAPLIHPNYQANGPEYRDTLFHPSNDIMEDMLRNKRAFPGLNYECVELFGENDKICFVGYFSGRHEGELYGIKPTGNLIHGTFSQIFTIKDGKIISSNLFNDSLALFQQIGQAVLLQDNKVQIESYLNALRKIGLLPQTLESIG